MGATKRWLALGAAVFIMGGAAGVAGFHVAVQILKGKVIEALGPGSELKEIKVGWSSIELLGLVIDAPRGWPAARTFQAERVRIVPSLRTLFSDRIEIASITVEKPYLSVVRVPGKLLILPTLLSTQGNGKSTGEARTRTLVVSKVLLENGIVDVFDATVSRPPLKIRLEQIDALVRNIAPGDLQQRTTFDLAATAKGNSAGRIAITGWVAGSGKDSSSHVVMNNMDLVGLQPYIVKRGDARISRGTVDLNLKSEVRDHRLQGAGSLSIKDLAFAPSQSYLGTFMGLPRTAVIGFLKDHDNSIQVDFTLSGDVRSPDFSLNETLATRVASGMAGQLGVSIQGLAEGLGSLGRRGVEGAAGTANAIGSIFKGLFEDDASR